MIGNGADAQSPFAVPGGIHIQGGGLHLQRHNAHFLQAVDAVQPLRHTHMVAVEHIGRIDVAHMVLRPVILAGFHRLAEQRVVRDGGKGAGNMELVSEIGIGAGTLRQHDVIQFNMILNGSGRPDPDDVLHAEEVEQLVGIDADGRHAHAGGHDGHLHAFVPAGIAVNAPDVIDQDGIFQKMLRDELGAQGIAGHQHGLAEANLIGHVDMGGSGEVGHNEPPYIYFVGRGHDPAEPVSTSDTVYFSETIQYSVTSYNVLIDR